MGRSLSPVLRQELANLDKDADSRRSAMRALKTYVKDLDSKAIPMFLAQVSQSKETGLSGECTISLYEVLARVHGVKIVPLIDSIMGTIVKTLSSSAGSFPLQQACSKVVPAIARYGIDPTTPEDKRRNIIHSLCNPLADSLRGSRESLTSGAALCLKALVDSDNWRFASDEMVSRVCQVVASALEEKPTQTNAHMGLATTLAKRNAPLVEPYAWLLIQAGIHILNSGLAKGNSQKRLSAIQMVNFLMRWLDPWSLCSELKMIIDEMEKCQADQMAYVRGAAFEALLTAKRILADKESKFEKSPVSVAGSNFSRREFRRGLSTTPRDLSPVSVTPEERTINSFADYELWSESPISTMNSSCLSAYDRRSVNRKLWSFENGGIDVSLKDGLLSQSAMADSSSDYVKRNGDPEEFMGFTQRNPMLRMSRSTTTSPLRSQDLINVDDIIFNTPRKLVQSLQDPNNSSSNFYEKQPKRIKSLSLTDFDWSSVSRCDQNYTPSNGRNGSSYNNGYEKLQQSRESVSSTTEMAANNVNVGGQILEKRKTRSPKFVGESPGFKFLFVLVVVVLMVFARMSEYNQFDDGHYHLVPT